MNLDHVTVKIRPRNQWEAIDMGCIVARNWFTRLWLLWLTFTLPVTLILILVSFALPGTAPKWAMILFWLCKPLYEPPLLIWVSKAVFGEKLSIRKTLFEIKKILSLNWMWSVFLYRFNLTRSFSIPILLLEGLKGRKRKERSALLSNGYETSIYLTGATFLIEIFLSLALLTVLFWLIPEELRWIDFGEFVFTTDSWVVLVAYISSCSIVAPFYTCGGFMLYISRRVELEAWDIEIGFKRIEQRLRERKNNSVKCVVPILVCLLPIVATLISSPVSADEINPDTAKTVIVEVMQQKDFGEKKTMYRWVPKQEERTKPESGWLEMIGKFLSKLAEIARKATKNIAAVVRVLVWVLAGCLVAFIVMRYSQINTWLSNRLVSGQKTFTPPALLFGMDIRPESLPENIKDVCSRLLETGDKRKALSLLYRSSLSHLVNNLQLQIKTSSTEQECRDVVIRYRPKAESVFFSRLTAIWLSTAYGHREPDTGSCKELIHQWKGLFGV